MIYFIGMLGFVGGFIFGMMLVNFLLRHRPKEDLLHDKSLKWKFGLIVWATALLGAYSFVKMYDLYF